MPRATISLETLSHNLSTIKNYLSEATDVLVAVKANAYGHGAVETAQHLESIGVTWFGVATAHEALELRSGGINANILIFSPVYSNISELVNNDICLTIADDKSLECAKTPSGKNARVHLKVDTGMGRLGLGWQEAVNLAQKVDALSNVELEGVWTHFAASDDEDRRFTLEQLEAFELFLDELEKRQIHPRLRHASNSAAIFAYPEAQFDLVRPGIAAYGYHSSPYIAGLEPNLKPALTLSAPITFVKQVKKGTPISYSSLWHAPKDTTIATVRIGYADGYPRLLTGKGEVLVQGELRPIAGRVCMDQLMVDVGALEVKVGDRVTLFGPDTLDAETLAGRIGTISYELLTSIGSRVERIYL